MKREEAKILIENIDKSILRIADVKDIMINQFRHGKIKGSKTYVSDIDEVMVNSTFKSRAWSWKPGEMNIWSGYNNEGKTKMLVYLALLKAINEGKKFVFFSPENFPPDEFFDDMVHTLVGTTTDRLAANFSMSEDTYVEALEKIQDMFYVVYPLRDGKPDFRISVIEDVFKFLVWENDVFGCIVDPYIKIRHEMEPGEPEHLYASRFMMDRINFTRENQVSYNLVMHQVTPRKLQDGNYPKPNLYSIKGGGTFADSADNVITIWRPLRGTDPISTEVSFISEKIKNQKLVGIPFEVEMNFDRKKNRYISLNGRDYLDGSVKMKEDVYNPDKFTSSEIADFSEPPPF